jgi:hypothetical protein
MALRQGQEITLADFSGGQASVKNLGTLALNEVAVADNVVIKPTGAGFRNRNGNTAFNSTAMASGATGTGLGVYRVSPTEEYLVGVCGGSIFQSNTSSGTMTDITSTLTVSSSPTEQWHLFQYEDLLIGVGGAPNATFKWTGTGNAALLGGSAPQGTYGFSYGNRAFIMNGDTIYWSALVNAEDWTTVGSAGSAVVQPGDGDDLITAATLNVNTVLLFKQNSTHIMTGRSQPFPIFPLFTNVGCVGKHACVVADGLAYFVTAQGYMVITDGQKIYDERDLPQLNNAGDVWGAFSKSRLPYLIGSRIQAPDFDWIVWSGTKTSPSRNDYAVIWDLTNKCWITGSTGFNGAVFATTQDGTPYMIGYDGKIYKLNVSSTFTDASNASANVSWTMESDWMSLDSLIKVIQLQQFRALYQTRASGSLTLTYGYDFMGPNKTKTWSIAATGSLWDTALWDAGVWAAYTGKIGEALAANRGNVFKWRLSGSSAVDYQISKVALIGRHSSQKTGPSL